MEEAISRTLVDLIDDGIWDSPWHTLREATSEFTDECLDYMPVAGVPAGQPPDMARPARYGARAIVRHLLGATLEAAEAIGAEGDPPAEDEWHALQRVDYDGGAETLVRMMDGAFRVARERAARLAAEALAGPAADTGGFSGWTRLEAAVQCFVLHPHWHFGQLASLARWLQVGGGAAPVPPRPSTEESLAPCADFPFRLPELATPKSLLCECLRQAQVADPWHGFERVIEGMTPEEASWLPFAEGVPTARHLVLHVASCDVVYADWAFGERRADWDSAGEAVGFRGEPWTPEDCLAGVQAGYAFLSERLENATDEQLAATHTMPHGHEMTGFQVAATMIQHRLWHAGQIALVRDAYGGVGG